MEANKETCLETNMEIILYGLEPTLEQEHGLFKNQIHGYILKITPFGQ